MSYAPTRNTAAEDPTVRLSIHPRGHGLSTSSRIWWGLSRRGLADLRAPPPPSSNRLFERGPGARQHHRGDLCWL